MSGKPQKSLENKFQAAYLRLPEGELRDKLALARRMLDPCGLCPRNCGARRTIGETGFCGVPGEPFISSHGPHFGEEQPLVGRSGSGTIFLGGCNLGCVFCQNHSISHAREGVEASPTTVAAIMLGLQESGCLNINLVTPTHQMPMLLDALIKAKHMGLRLPVVYNTGGYETLDALTVLDGVVDIYMPDFKYTDPAAAAEYSDAGDYPDVARAALREMHRQVGDLKLDEYGVASRGLLVRHLVLPEGKAGTPEAMRFLAEEISKDTYVNIMDQYRPCFKASDYQPLRRRITVEEYREAVQAAIDAGLKRIDGIWDGR